MPSPIRGGLSLWRRSVDRGGTGGPPREVALSFTVTTQEASMRSKFMLAALVAGLFAFGHVRPHGLGATSGGVRRVLARLQSLLRRLLRRLRGDLRHRGTLRIPSLLRGVRRSLRLHPLLRRLLRRIRRALQLQHVPIRLPPPAGQPLLPTVGPSRSGDPGRTNAVRPPPLEEMIIREIRGAKA